MENRLISLMLSWGGVLGFTAFCIAYMERFSFHAGIPWLLELFRAAVVFIVVILLLRFLSFRAQKPWEKMKSAYSQTAGLVPVIRVSPDHGGLNLALYLGWTASGLIALVLGFPPLLEKSGWQPALLLDLATWTFAWVWAAKVSWLRAAQSRETLKMSLDDLRSKRGLTASPLKEFKPGSPRVKGLFAFLFLLGLTGLVAETVWRLRGASGNAAKAAVGRCLERSWRAAAMSFVKEAKPSEWKTPNCGGDENSYRWDFIQEGGGITISAWEAENSDAFGDGRNGNQGLRLVPEGTWVEMQRPQYSGPKPVRLP